MGDFLKRKGIIEAENEGKNMNAFCIAARIIGLSWSLLQTKLESVAFYL